MNFYQIVLPIFTLVFLLQVFVIRSIYAWKTTGKNPVVFSKTDTAHDYAGHVYNMMIIGIWVSIALFSFAPTYYQYLMPIWYLNYEWLKVLGIVISIVSFTWIIVAQFQMSKSWKIGIDYSEKPELIKKGTFNISRNPIFLGVIISYLGTFLIIPNVLTFCVLILTYVVLQFQVRLEEEYLTNKLGNEYLDYKSTVRRWL